MANEISISQTLRYAKSGVAASQSTSFTVDQSGDKYMAGVQIIGVTEEALDKGDIGTIGYISFKNLDTTNYVQIGITTGVYSIKVLAGKGGMVPWNSATAPLVKANSSPVELDYLMIEA